jgi:hypothetical protein
VISTTTAWAQVLQFSIFAHRNADCCLSNSLEQNIT